MSVSAETQALPTATASGSDPEREGQIARLASDLRLALVALRDDFERLDPLAAMWARRDLAFLTRMSLAQWREAAALLQRAFGVPRGDLSALPDLRRPLERLSVYFGRAAEAFGAYAPDEASARRQKKAMRRSEAIALELWHAVSAAYDRGALSLPN